LYKGLVPAVTGGTIVADSQACSGTALYAPSTGLYAGYWWKVADITVSQAASSVADQCGRYLAILRAKLYPGANTKYIAQLRYGTMRDSLTSNPTVLLNNTYGYNLYVMGEVDIGSQTPYYVDSAPIDWQNFRITLYAQLTAGTANLYLDTIFLVPLEGFVSVGMPDWSSRVSYYQNSYFAMQRPDGGIGYSGSTECLGISLPGLYLTGSLQMQGGIPPGPGMAVIVGQCGDISVKTTKCKLSVRAIPRWKELRGAD